MQNIVMHVDMNSYFASVAQQDNLAWRGKPVGVCEHLGGIIIAASIEAKKLGIKTGTPVWEAKKLYPKIILTKTQPDRYRLYTSRLVKIVSDYAGSVEKYSIDEVFLDVTKVTNIRCKNENIKYETAGKILHPRPQSPAAQAVGGQAKSYILHSHVDPFEEAVKIAREIKRRVKAEVGDWLTCSIGIAENKLLSKIGSDMQKPDGLVVVRNELKSKISNLKSKNVDTSRSNYIELTKEDLYSQLKLIDIPGIGRRQEKRLNSLGIRTLLDLKGYPESQLVSLFGIGGHHLHQMGQLEGSWKTKVEDEEKIKSIGHMYTLPREFRDIKFFTPVLYKLCEMVGKRLREQHLCGTIIHFYLRPSTNFYNNRGQAVTQGIQSKIGTYSSVDKIGDGASDKNYEGLGQSKKLGYEVSDGRQIFLEAVRIFENITGREGSGPFPTEYKLIGVTMAGLVPETKQLSLFERDYRSKRVITALDQINEKYGNFTVCRVPVLKAKDAFQDSVGFGRMKEFKQWKVKNS